MLKPALREVMPGLTRTLTDWALRLDFKDGVVDPMIVTTRAGTQTYFDAAGVMQTAAADTLVLTYDQTIGEWVASIWGARTNLLLNSTTLATQSITTTAAARTLSFYGTGSVVLSGTHAATVVGLGAYPVRTTYTYTPTAGALTLTVSGTVENAQDELGNCASPWISTAGATVTRPATVPKIDGMNFTGFYNQTEGTFVVEAACFPTSYGTAGHIVSSNDGTAVTNIVLIQRNAATLINVSATVASVAQVSTPLSAMPPGVYSTIALAYKINDYAASKDGEAVVTDTAGTVPTVSQLNIGSRADGTRHAEGYFKSVTYYAQKLSLSELPVTSK